jgi:peroxiredoxin
LRSLKPPFVLVDEQRPSPVGVGDQAPPFALPASNGEVVALEESLTRGPVVLLWYVFDFGRI